MIYEYIIIIVVFSILLLAVLKLNKKNATLEVNKLVIYLGGNENIIDAKFDDNWTPNQLVENLINVIYPKYGVKDLKALLLSFSNGKNTFKMNKEKFKLMEDLVKRSPKILSNIDIGKINRPVSYMIFYLREIYEFFNLKTEDGVYYFELKEKNEILKKKKAEIERLLKLLKENQDN